MLCPGCLTFLTLVLALVLPGERCRCCPGLSGSGFKGTSVSYNNCLDFASRIPTGTSPVTRVTAP